MIQNQLSYFLFVKSNTFSQPLSTRSMQLALGLKREIIFVRGLALPMNLLNLYKIFEDSIMKLMMNWGAHARGSIESKFN